MRVMSSQVAIELARELGFDLAGIAPLRPPPDAARFERWLERGHHAGLDYLERNRRRIVDPRTFVPQGRSILVLGLAHSRPAVELRDGGRVARYAAGRDYHTVVGRMLRKLQRRLVAEGVIRPRSAWRKVVDSGPLLERSHAAESGIGFASKAANLLHPRFGPWFFLAELVLDVELEPTTEPPAGSCGTCTACIDACPTAAILEPGSVDANRCISFHTIESSLPIPHELRPRVGPWAFGCDVCSEVCPWGRTAPDLSQRFGTSAPVANGSLVQWLEPRDETSWAHWLAGSPLQRPGRDGLARNAAIALGNLPSDQGRRALLHALTFDPAAIVRESAAWSLLHAHGDEPTVRGEVERAAARESDDASRAGIARSLEQER
jgi:epoxyqueuosine reductase